MADHACVIVSINFPKIHRDSLCHDVAFPAKDLVRKVLQFLNCQDTVIFMGLSFIQE